MGMKRLIALLLAAGILTLSVFAASAAETDTAGKTHTENTIEAELLKTLEIFDNETDLQSTVTRAEFAGYMARLLNVEEYNRYDRLYFVDVPATYWKSNSINGLAELGIISGDGKSAFRPDDNITVSEVSSMLLKAMGYDELANIEGGYPAGYMRVFSELELDSGLESSGETLTNADIAKILYNSFDVPMYKMSGASGDYVIMDGDENDTFLYNCMGIRGSRGRVTGAAGLSLTDAPALTAGHITIEGRTYDADDAYARKYLGRYVDFWYLDDEENGISEIVFMYETRESDIVTINAEDIISYDGASGSVSYYRENNTRRSAKLNINAEITVNGTKDVPSVAEAINGLKYGQITLYDTDGGNGYDAAVIEDCEVCVVNSYDGGKNVIYTDDIEGRQIAADDYAEVFVFLDSGETSSLSDIREGDVLTIIRSDDYLEIYISRKTAAGVIDFSTADSVTIDDTEYPLNDYITETHGLVFNAGSSVLIRLDRFGIVVDCESEGGDDMSLAYIRSIYRDEAGDLFFKLYLFTHEFVTLKPAQRVTVDGAGYKNTELELGVFSANGGVFTPMLIRYGVNADGEINRIDTPVKTLGEPEETLTCNQEFDSLAYNGSGRIGTKNVLSLDGTTVLAVPTDTKVAKAGLKDFELGTPRDMMIGDVTYEVATYTIGDNKGAEDIAVIKRDLEYRVDYLSPLLLVGNIYEGLNGDEEVVKIIEGMQGTSERKYYLDPSDIPDGMEINKGDILHIEADGQNNIRSIEMLYRYTQENYGDPTPQWGSAMYGSFNDSFRLSWGYITSIEDKVIKWGYTSPDEVDEAYYWTQNVVFFDGTRAWIGTLDEVTTAESNPVSPDRIIVKARYGTISYVFIYKDPT